MKIFIFLWLLLHSLISIADDRGSCFASLKNIANETNELSVISASLLEKSTKTNTYRIPSEFVNLPLMSYAASSITASGQALSLMLYFRKNIAKTVPADEQELSNKLIHEYAKYIMNQINFVLGIISDMNTYIKDSDVQFEVRSLNNKLIQLKEKYKNYSI